MNTSRSKIEKLNMEWPEEVDIAQAFTIASKIHRLIEQNEGTAGDLGVNYLNLIFTGSSGWAASFDCGTGEDWQESVDAYPFAAAAPTPEEAIRLAAVKTRDAFLKAREKKD